MVCEIEFQLNYSTVTLLARFLGMSGLYPLFNAN